MELFGYKLEFVITTENGRRCVVGIGCFGEVAERDLRKAEPPESNRYKGETGGEGTETPMKLIVGEDEREANYHEDDTANIAHSKAFGADGIVFFFRRDFGQEGVVENNTAAITNGGDNGGGESEEDIGFVVFVLGEKKEGHAGEGTEVAEEAHEGFFVAAGVGDGGEEGREEGDD